MKTFDMQTNNIAYSNFRNANTMSRLTQDSTNCGNSGITPISTSKKQNYSKNGKIESDTYTLKGNTVNPIHSFSPKSVNKFRKRGIEQS
jgi:hypothetical protein